MILKCCIQKPMPELVHQQILENQQTDYLSEPVTAQEFIIIFKRALQKYNHLNVLVGATT